LRRVDARHSGIENAFRAALTLAREQGALALELRAATGLATWLGESKHRAEGLELIRGVYGRFTEGFATPDLKAAKATIDSLA
jgi:predicted ATPase